MTLDEVHVNQSAVITKVGGEGVLRGRLLDMGLIPKTAVTVIKYAPMGDPIEIRLRGYELTIRKDDAKMIEVNALCNSRLSAIRIAGKPRCSIN